MVYCWGPGEGSLWVGSQSMSPGDVQVSQIESASALCVSVDSKLSMQEFSFDSTGLWAAVALCTALKTLARSFLKLARSYIMNHEL